MPTVPRTVRFVIAGILVIHGLIHVLGVVTNWEIAEVDELGASTLFDVEPGGGPALVLGLLWLVAALGFVAAGVGLAARARWTRTVAAAAAAVSLVVTVMWWSDAWIGAVVSAVVCAVVLAAVLAGPGRQDRRSPTAPAARSVA